MNINNSHSRQICTLGISGHKRLSTQSEHSDTGADPGGGGGGGSLGSNEPPFPWIIRLTVALFLPPVLVMITQQIFSKQFTAMK